MTTHRSQIPETPCSDTGTVTLPPMTQRLSVQDAITLVINAKPFPLKVGGDGLTSLERAVNGIENKFLSACDELSISPRDPDDPFAKYDGSASQTDLFEITIEEFERFAFSYGVLVEGVDICEDPDKASKSISEIPLPRGLAREKAIIQLLREKNYDPLALPPNKPGKAGVKAEIKSALGNRGLWAGKKVFDKAWEKLAQNKDIAYKK